MKNEIKVNEYVRTKLGEIYKIEDGEEFYEDNIDVGIGIIPDVDGIWIDKEHFTYVDKREIVKHSPNIIDLIEEGDYVNGKKILEIKRNAENGLRYLMYDYVPIKYYIERTDKIKTIVTKEMMESISYKVTKM